MAYKGMDSVIKMFENRLRKIISFVEVGSGIEGMGRCRSRYRSYERIVLEIGSLILRFIYITIKSENVLIVLNKTPNKDIILLILIK